MARLCAAAFIIAALAGSWLIYQPGLRGGFLFDDYGTLSALGDYGQIDTLAEAQRFVLTGNAGPAGRPVSLATFLIDRQGWPSDPSVFKRTNLLLHLLAGLLVGWVTLAVAHARKVVPQQARWAAAIAAAFWMLHPLFVSTTLYIVQRMTILAAIFVMAGLVAHVHLRTALSRASAERTLPLLVLMAASLGTFTVIAFLSKENGALLPVLALVLEATVLANVPAGSRPGAYRWWKVIVLGLPTALIAGYLVSLAVRYGSETIASRGYTIGERVLSEGRVLIDYLRGLVLPQIDSGGIYHDDFALSTGLLHPATTLACWAIIAALLAFAWIMRRRNPMLSCAILFFFAGHALEGTTVPLELYFEHRNYLPAVFLAVCAGDAIARLGARRGTRYAAILTAAVIAILAALSAQRSALWGNSDGLLLYWAERSPTSERSQLEAAQVHLRRHDREHALRHLDLGLSSHPDSISLLAVRLGALCDARLDTAGDFARLVEAVRRAPYGPNTKPAMEALLDSTSLEHCAAAPSDGRVVLADALLANPLLANAAIARQQALFFKGLAAIKSGDAAGAYGAFQGALETHYEFEAGMRMVAELAGASAPACALRLLEGVEALGAAQRLNGGMLSAIEPNGADARRREIDHLRRAISQETPDATATACTSP